MEPKVTKEIMCKLQNMSCETNKWISLLIIIFEFSRSRGNVWEAVRLNSFQKASGLISFLVKKNIASKSCKCAKKLTSNPPLCPGDWGGCDFNWVVDKEDIYLVLPCVHILCNSVCYLYGSRNRKYFIIWLATVKSDLFCEWWYANAYKQESWSG